MDLYSWHRIEGVSASGLGADTLQEVALAGKRIGIVKRGDAIFAFAATCPHASGNLCNGWIDPQGRIVCPEHKYRFDPANGRNTSGEGYKLMTYPTGIKEDCIFIGIIDKADESSSIS